MDGIVLLKTVWMDHKVQKLARDLAAVLKEDQIYRIDHYLGKKWCKIYWYYDLLMQV